MIDGEFPLRWVVGRPRTRQRMRAAFGTRSKTKLESGSIQWDHQQVTIAGGLDRLGRELLPGARPCAPSWLAWIVDQCRAAGTACFVKQLGSLSGLPGRGKQDDPALWPLDLRVQEFPTEIAR